MITGDYWEDLLWEDGYYFYENVRSEEERWVDVGEDDDGVFIGANEKILIAEAQRESKMELKIAHLRRQVDELGGYRPLYYLGKFLVFDMALYFVNGNKIFGPAADHFRDGIPLFLESYRSNPNVRGCITKLFSMRFQRASEARGRLFWLFNYMDDEIVWLFDNMRKAP